MEQLLRANWRENLRKNQNIKLKIRDERMNGWMDGLLRGRVYRKQGGRLQGCSHKEHQNLGEGKEERVDL